MPIIKSAKKKLRQDKKRTSANNRQRSLIDGAVHALKKLTGKKAEEHVKKAHSVVDKAKKRGVIHANKAARIKSRISKAASK